MAVEYQRINRRAMLRSILASSALAIIPVELAPLNYFRAGRRHDSTPQRNFTGRVRSVKVLSGPRHQITADGAVLFDLSDPRGWTRISVVFGE